MGWLALLGSLLSALPMNLACERDPARLVEARELYEAGLEDAEQGRWVVAERAFRRSYGISCSTAALFNLSAVLAALGRVVETRDVIEQLLGEDIDAEVARQARARLEQASRLISQLILVGMSVEPHSLVLDGTEVEDTGARPFRIDADPRAHSLLVRRDGHEPFVWNGDLDPGSSREVEIALTPINAPGSGVDEGLIVALAIGGAVLAAGAAVAIGVAATSSPQGLVPYYPVLEP